MSKPVVHALIPAAGLGLRFGGSALKQYMNIAGKPVLSHSIQAVNLYPEIDGITVVISKDDNMFNELIKADYKGVNTVHGGASRAESVLKGLRFIRDKFPETEWVMVHDAARPCLSPSHVRNLLEKGLQCRDGAILGMPVRDTLKRVTSEERIVNTVDRSMIWSAQTPQLFPLKRLQNALEEMLYDGHSPTDEASAMERAGAKPLMVMGCATNIKITWPEDIAIAESWLRDQKPLK